MKLFNPGLEHAVEGDEAKEGQRRQQYQAEGVERGADAGGCGDQPEGDEPADTAPMKIVARLVDSVIAAVRAPCRVKCSVVTNATAVGCGAAPSAPVLAFWSLLVVSPAFGSGFEIYAALPLACRLASDEIRLRQ
jgi:hypothetical protein